MILFRSTSAPDSGSKLDINDDHAGIGAKVPLTDYSPPEKRGGGGLDCNYGLRDGARFRRWIRDRAACAQRAADYFVPEREVVRGPTTVHQPYRFVRTG